MTAPHEHSNRPPPPPGTTSPFGEAPGEGPTGSGPDWAAAGDWTAPHHADPRCLELCPICRGAEILRGAGGPELRGQLDDVGREALLTLRALVDHYLERLESRPKGAAAERVERIPID
ncbi:MAG TPA: hypothetical protein VFH44_06645 [Solirubrobacterales bacterium]|nr:hypothetical protein [Solirubrobacterales bacterium]